MTTQEAIKKRFEGTSDKYRAGYIDGMEKCAELMDLLSFKDNPKKREQMEAEMPEYRIVINTREQSAERFRQHIKKIIKALKK